MTIIGFVELYAINEDLVEKFWRSTDSECLIKFYNQGGWFYVVDSEWHKITTPTEIIFKEALGNSAARQMLARLRSGNTHNSSNNRPRQ